MYKFLHIKISFMQYVYSTITLCEVMGAPWSRNREYGRRDRSRWSPYTDYQQKFALTSPTSRGRSVGIFRSRTKATEYLIGGAVLELELHWCLSPEYGQNRCANDGHSETAGIFCATETSYKEKN
jgi:hypothetical protein